MVKLDFIDIWQLLTWISAFLVIGEERITLLWEQV